MASRVPLRVAGALAAGAATLTLLAGSPASAKKVAKESPSRVQICHKGRTITVSSRAVPGHARHGDTTGPCATTTTAVAGP